MPERVYAAREQHFTFVDIPQPGHHALIQQSVRNLLTGVRKQPLLRLVRRKIRSQQIRA